MHNQKVMDGYIRVSRVNGREGDSFLSPEVQRQAIDAWATLHNMTLGNVYVELDESGKHRNRPMLKEALNRARTGVTSGIVAAKLDRISRSIAHLGDLLDDAKDQSWNLVALDLGLDLATPNGRLIAKLIGTIAEWELERRTEDWKVAVERAVDRGVYISAKPPTGYTRIDEGPDKGRLKLDPKPAAAIRECYLRRARGSTWQELAHHLESEGIPTPWRNTIWTKEAVHRLVQNRAYLGESRQGEIVNPTAHEPLVSEKEWQAAQPSSKVILPKHGSRSALCVLRGVLACGGCGKTLLVTGAPERNGKVPPPHYYRRTRHASGICPAPASARHTRVDEYVEQQLLEAFDGDGPLVEAVAAQERVEAAAREVEAAREELFSYMAATATLGIDADALRAGAEARQQRLDQAEATLEAARDDQAVLGEVTDGDLIRAWKNGELTTIERRTLIAGMVDRVILYRSKTPGRVSKEPISDRIQIVMRGNVVLALAQGEEQASATP